MIGIINYKQYFNDVILKHFINDPSIQNDNILLN